MPYVGKSLFEQQAQVAARRISKMERIGLLGQVTTLFAHEVRQPLSVIAVYAYGLRRQIERRAVPQRGVD